MTAKLELDTSALARRRAWDARSHSAALASQRTARRQGRVRAVVGLILGGAWIVGVMWFAAVVAAPPGLVP